MHAIKIPLQELVNEHMKKHRGGAYRRVRAYWRNSMV